MTDLQALLAAVIHRPADDTPRLVYAELCDDHGEHERAEFIRAQLELARGVKHNHRHRDFGGNPDGCRACKLHRAACRWVESEAGGKAEYRAAFRHSGDIWYGGHGLGVDSGVWVEFSRGFADELRCDLRTFVGGECERCGGDGLDAMADHHRATPCRQCRGTGRVGLDLAAVFAAHPIARVATDREPTAASHQSGAWHWTWVGNDADSRVGLPRKLMAALSASGIARVFDSRDAAMDALSLACVNLGRAAAGLDPLT